MHVRDDWEARRSVTFTQLRALVAVAEDGGFTGAAERLGMSQPAVSRAVAALERELGAALLSRGRDGAVLTEAGRRVVAHARETVRRGDLIREEVAAVRGEVRGRLAVASFPTVTARLMPGLLRRFGERYPHVRARLFEGTDQEVRRWLDERVADVAVVTLPARGVETHELARDAMVAVVPAGHRLASRPSASIADLSRDPFVMSTGGCEPIITAAARAARVRLQAAYEARETATVIAMVEAGLGVSIVPTLALEETGEGRPGLAVLALVPAVERRLALALPAGAEASPAARAFVTLSLG